MMSSLNRTLRLTAKVLVATFTALFVVSMNISPAQAFAGTLENGNLAYAQSEFNKGEACNYLPGYETGYDAWHFVLTTRGATFQQSPQNPAIAINLNLVFMRQDGSLFVIRSGAWVQTGKGAYTYTLVSDRIRMVQAGSLAQVNGSDSGMRLSHTCPGSGTAVVTSPSPTPTSTATATRSPSPSPTSTATRSPSPTASPSISASPSVSASPSASASASASPSVSASPSPTTSSTRIPTLAPRPSTRASAVQVRPSRGPNSLPTPSPSPQSIDPTPTPSPSSSPSPTPSPTVEPTSSPTATPTPLQSSTPAAPAPLPTPPPVEDPKNVVYVEPKKPATIDPETFPEAPASKVEVTKEPTYGDLKTNSDGTFTYTPPTTPPAAPVVDVVEFKYTNLSGEAVIVRKEFVMTVKGDVPSIIQTGGSPITNSLTFWFVAILALAGVASLVRFVGKRGYVNA